MEKNAPEISVIVPVYNARQYLAKCIDSILSQTFTDFELLLIDDGSPDRCGEICDEYARKDRRIRVFHQENKGVSAARNVGMEAMTGRYLAFIDADDWAYPDYLRYLYEALPMNGGSGLIVQGFRCFDARGADMQVKSLPNRLYEEKDFGRAICECNLAEWGYSASKLYKVDVIRNNHLRFDTRIHCLEDLLFMYRYLFHCDYLLLGDRQEYAYIRHLDSISHTIRPFDSVYAGFRLYRALFIEMQERWQFPVQGREGMIRSMMMGFDWSLKTDYCQRYDVPRKTRISHLRLLINDNYRMMCNYYHPVYKLDKIGKMLLKARLYGLYDCYIVFLIRMNITSFLHAPHP